MDELGDLDLLDDEFKDDKFNWDAYLQQTDSQIVPAAFFPHVNKKADTILETGMKVEIPYIDEKGKEKHWIATVLHCLGPVVRLRYEGDTNDLHDQWKMVTSFKAHHLGWAKKCNIALTPPPHLTHLNVEEILESVQNSKTMEEFASFEFEQFVPGMKLEIEDELSPYKVWAASILENYGGRLLLRYDSPGLNDTSFWLFYTSRRIHPYGWVKSQGPPWSLEKPSHKFTEEHGVEEWAAFQEMNSFDFEMECKISQIRSYKYRPPSLKHNFQVGMKLEAIDPVRLKHITPATISEIIDEFYFIVNLDNTEDKFLATLDHPYIFPAGWAQAHQCSITFPNSSSCWDEYRDSTDTKLCCFERQVHINHEQILPGMKLEVIEPLNRHQTCVGTILAICEDLAKVKLQLNEACASANQTYLFSFSGTEVFPAGWSNTVNHPFIMPCDNVPSNPIVIKDSLPPPQHVPEVSKDKTILYVNSKCFTGPFLSKSKIATLPKCIGPGRVRLVLLDMIKRVANLGYVQMRILRELQAPRVSAKERLREELKVKYKKKVYKGTIELVDKTDHLEAYLLEFCNRLQVCPNLISRRQMDECPLNCSERNKGKAHVNNKRSNGNKQVIDYKPLIYKPHMNPLVFLNRTPFQEETLIKESTTEEKVVWTKEKNLRKRKVTVVCQDDEAKKRVKTCEEDKDKNSDENSPDDDKWRMEIEDVSSRRSKRIQTRYGFDKTSLTSIIASVRNFNEKKLQLPDSNPLFWSVDDVYACVSKAKEISRIAGLLREELFDGQSLMMLNFPVCIENLKLDLKTSILLCRFVEVVKVTFFTRYVKVD